MLSKSMRKRLILVILFLLVIHVFILPSDPMTAADRQILKEADDLIKQHKYLEALQLLQTNINFHTPENLKPFLNRLELAEELHSSDTAFTLAMQCYNEGNYASALRYFRQVKPKDVKNFTDAREMICQLDMAAVKDVIKDKKAAEMQ